MKSELIEWSIVAVPADPDALRGAYTRVMKALIEHSGDEFPKADHDVRPRIKSGAGSELVEGQHTPVDSAEIDLAETRSLLETLSRTVRVDAAHTEFCRDPPTRREYAAMHSQT